MREEIKVHVVKYPDRPNLMMRYFDFASGKHIARSTRTTRKREAERLAAKWEAELREGRYERTSRMAWDELVGSFLNSIEIKPTTAANYLTTFAAFEEISRPSRVGDLTSERIRAFKASLRKGRKYTTKGKDGKPKTKTRKVSEATIHKHLRNLRALAKWAHGEGMLPRLPKFEFPKVAGMKGRPITGEEFDRMLAATAGVVGDKAAESWKHLLRGLWWSGLRISEAMALRWDDAGDVSITLNGQRSVLLFWEQKNGKAEVVPAAPEFVTLLEPHQKAAGFVFAPGRKDGRPLARHVLKVSKTIAGIGEAAGVITDPDKGRTASAHDLRRSFGTRWAKRVMPPTLKQMMRHADINTTMRYYVNQSAEVTASELWAVVGNNLGNSEEIEAGEHQKTP